MQWLATPLHLRIAIGVIVLLLILTWWSWLDHRRATWKQAFKLLKPVKQVKPPDLNNEFKVCEPGETAPTDKRPFYEGYVPRRLQPYHPQDATKSNRPENDAQLLAAIRRGEHILLVGTPTQGKTRTAYELIRQLKGYTVVIPHSERPTPTEALGLLKNRRIVLFLDDLNYIKSTTALDVVHFVDEVTRQARSLAMVATCRDGDELLQVTELTSHRVKQLYERFRWVLTLEDVSADEKKQMAQRSGLALAASEVASAPTLGWVVMEEAYKKMYDRFRRLSAPAQETLWTLQLLSAADVLPLTQDRVKQVRAHVFETDPHSCLTDVLRILTNEDFLRKPSTNDPVQARDAYLSLVTKKIVVPYVEGRAPNDDFKKLGEVLTQMGDEKGLESLGITLSVQYGDHAQALTYFEGAHRLNPTNAQFLFAMGVAFYNLGQHEEEIKSYQEALKHKEDYYEAWNNMGNTFGKLSQHEEAIKSYREALKHKEDFHEAWNNMGVAFGELGQYEEAIKSYREAVKYKEDYYEA